MIIIIEGGDNKYVTVNDEDYEILSKYRWRYEKIGSKEYARSNGIYMHRFILGVTDTNIQVDHRNGNGLCNERWNLRTCTLAQNCANRKPRGGSSKYKGVFRYKDKNGIKWRARIEYNNRGIHIGYFRKEIDAAIAYNRKAKELHGEFAYQNIIEDGDLLCR